MSRTCRARILWMEGMSSEFSLGLLKSYLLRPNLIPVINSSSVRRVLPSIGPCFKWSFVEDSFGWCAAQRPTSGVLGGFRTLTIGNMIVPVTWNVKPCRWSMDSTHPWSYGEYCSPWTRSVVPDFWSCILGRSHSTTWRWRFGSIYVMLERRSQNPP